MNHGHCKNCWWYKTLHQEGYKLQNGRLVKSQGDGICYMHTVWPGMDIEEPHIVNCDSWCPDYCNRARTNKKDKLTLEEWLNDIKSNRV